MDYRDGDFLHPFLMSKIVYSGSEQWIVNGICPLCNGINQFKVMCPVCENNCEDKGREIDYADQYSPYLDYDISAKSDGLTTENSNQYCTHMFYCPDCNEGFLKIINKNN